MSRSWKTFRNYRSISKGAKAVANRKYRKRPLNDTNIPYKKYTDSWNIWSYWYTDYHNNRDWGEPAYKGFMK